MQEIAKVQRLSKRVAELKPSGIRKFFDIVATMKDVISLGIGEPDFTTPKPILDAGIRSLQNGETHYTSNHGKLELRQGIADNLQKLYNVKYDPALKCSRQLAFQKRYISRSPRSWSRAMKSSSRPRVLLPIKPK